MSKGAGKVTAPSPMHRERQKLIDFGSWICEKYYPHTNSKNEACWVNQDWLLSPLDIPDEDHFTTEDLLIKYSAEISA